MPAVAGALARTGGDGAGCQPAQRRRAGDGAAPGPHRGRRRCRRMRDRQHGPGPDHVRVRADDLPVRRVKSRPAAAHGQRRRDPGQGVTGHDLVADRCRLARQHQDGAGPDDIRIGADERPVRRVKSRPAAAHAETRGDAGQRVTGLHDILRGRARRRHGCRGEAQRAGQGDLRYCSCYSYYSRCGCSPGRGGQIPSCRPPPTGSTECSRRAPRTRTSSTYALCCHFPSKGISAGRCWSGRQKHGPLGRKGLKRATPPAGKNATPAARQNDAPAAATSA